MKKKNFIMTLLAIIILITIVAFFIVSSITLVIGLINIIKTFCTFIVNFYNTTDSVIVVAMITGAVSITGVVISSIVSKILDYRYNKKKYLYEKREEPYEKFIELIYKIMEDSKKEQGEKMTEDEMIKELSEFSKGLTLWGSNRVVKKWLKYRNSAVKGERKEMLIQMEDIIYEIRKDVGAGTKMGKGNILSLFINDIENIIG